MCSKSNQYADRRRFLAAAGSGLALAVAGCAGGGSESPIPLDDGASVSFGMPSDGEACANGVLVHMTAENFRVEEAGTVNDNAGHYHVLIDTDPVAVGETVPSDARHLHFGDGSDRTVLDLATGEHRLVLQAADGQHRALPLTDEVSVTVEEGSVSFGAPEDGATVTSPVRAAFETSENLTVRPAGQFAQRTGHFHVLVGADPVAVGDPIPSDDRHRHFGDGSTAADLDLDPGSYTLTLQMGDGAHLAMPDTDSVDVTVEG